MFIDNIIMAHGTGLLIMKLSKFKLCVSEEEGFKFLKKSCICGCIYLKVYSLVSNCKVLY